MMDENMIETLRAVTGVVATVAAVLVWALV
jgi:hypothetical protein